MTNFYHLLQDKNPGSKIKISLIIDDEEVVFGEVDSDDLTNDFGINMVETLTQQVISVYYQQKGIVDAAGNLIPPSPNEPKDFFKK